MTNIKRLAIAEAQYNAFTAKAKLSEKAALMAKIKALMAAIEAGQI